MPQNVRFDANLCGRFSNGEQFVLFSLDLTSTLTLSVGDMQIYEINAGTLRPAGGRENFGHDHMVCRILVVEVGNRLVAVDTGIGSRDIASPTSRLGRKWLDLINPDLNEDETLATQLKALGYGVSDVTDIVLTHVHRDHVGGVGDFPSANVHIFQTEDVGDKPHAHSSFDGHENSGWADGALWASRPVSARPWRGFPTFALDGLPQSIRYLPLPGHTADHAGVLLEEDSGEFILHAGDAAFHRNQFLGGDVPFGIAEFTAATQADEAQRRNSESILSEISTWGDVRIVTAHSPD